MAKILKFAHALIIFLSLIVLVTSNGKFFFAPVLNFILYDIQITHLFITILFDSYLTSQIVCSV